MTQETTLPSDASATTETQQAQTGGTTHAEAKFTQADLDRLIGEARQKASDSARKKAFAEAGIDDIAIDAELLKTARAKREADKTEVERLAGLTAKEKERADKAEADLKTFQEQVETDMRRARLTNAVKDALTKANAKPDKVLALLQVQHADALAAVLKDDGMVDDAQVTKLVEVARTAYPEDFGHGGVGSPSLTGGRPATAQAPKVQTSGRL